MMIEALGMVAAKAVVAKIAVDGFKKIYVSYLFSNT